jgi:hypothetical protein
MRVSITVFASILITVALAVPVLGEKEVRDGSSYERAIIVPPDHKDYVKWEWDLLFKRFFDGQAMPKEHALVEHDGHMFDRFVFTTRKGEKVIYFDVTSFHRELAKELHTK